MKKIKFSALLLCACLLCSCANVQEENTKNEITLSEYTMPDATDAKVALYYLSEDMSHVLSVTERIERKSSSFYLDVMQVLLEGSETYTSPFDGKVKCNSAEQVQNVLNIDLTKPFLSLEKKKFYACCAVLASTFTSLAGIEFVNITVEGRQLTAPETGKKIMLLTSLSASPAELETKYSLSGGKTNSFYAVIYYSDDGQKRLLPRVKSITAANGEYARALVSALMSTDSSVFGEGFSLIKCSYSDSLLSVEANAPDGWKPSDSPLALDAIAVTTKCVYPDMKQVSLTVFGRTGELLFSASQGTEGAESKIRSKIDIFVPSDESIAYSSMLVSSMPARNDLKTFASEYVTTLEPSLYDKNVVNNVVLSDDVAIIDLKKEYYDVYAESGGERERAIVYSLIATVCTYSGLDRVMLLENGCVRSYFSGEVSLKNPLLTLPKEYLNSLKR